jgi:smad nuclear-interacting protein 1
MSGGVSEEEALAALLASAQKARDAKQPPKQPQSHASGRNKPSRWDRGGNNQDASRSSGGGQQQQQQRLDRPAVVPPEQDYYGRKRGRNDDPQSSQQKRPAWGREELPDEEEEEEAPVTDVQKPDFGLSGALASDAQTGNMYNGVVLKFSEPPEARTPNTRWRLYVFKKTDTSKEGDLLEVLHMAKQSAYLFGRDEKVADVRVNHPSLSKQHCVLQYRALPNKETGKLQCRPYLMDLGSTNGTFLNGVKLDDARYYELLKGDVITLGFSSREYVLLTENTTTAS